MKVSDFTHLLQYPNKVVSPTQTRELEDIIVAYPYFQAARAIHLKGLKNLNSFKYNNALKRTAAYTTDRDVLFDFITSKAFLQNAIADTISGKSIALADTEIISEEVLPNAAIETIQEATSTDNPLPQNIEEAEHILDPALFASKDPSIDEEILATRKKASEALELGKPLNFTKKEKYSFTEWLQLTSFKTEEAIPEEVSTAEETSQSDAIAQEDSLKKKKFDLIDKFIDSKPKIVPVADSAAKVNIKKSVKLNESELMTETLAKVYLEQKKYKKAIQAFKILSLKYPEKSGFFADRIKAVEKIQKENT